MLRYRCIAASALPAADRQVWHDILAQQADPLWHSPYFRPEFSEIVAQVRPDLQLALIHKGDQLQGFLPFHRLSAWRAEPLAGFLSDYHGPILSDTARKNLDLSALLNAMCVRQFSYNHLPLDWAQASQAQWRQTRSLLLDLSQGYQAYQAQLVAQRESGLLKKIATAKRKLAQKHGTVRFELASSNAHDFVALLEGKSQQYRRTVGAASDIFAQAWIRELMNLLFATSKPEFAGVLSCLYAGDKLIAAHFGLRSATTLHYWFPWYDTDYAEYSPGLIMLAECAEAAAAQGWQRIDLGRGEQAYKQRFATSSIELAEGIWSRPACLGRLQSSLFLAKAELRETALVKNVKAWRNKWR